MNKDNAKLSKKEKKQRLIRVLAIVLAALMVGSTILSVLITTGYAEEAAPARNTCEMNIKYMEDEQALQITQRLVYHNSAAFALDRVIFYAAANMFRRESALMYESDVLQTVFPTGFAPSGIELLSVRCDGNDADYGFQAADETALRVSCALEPGESCVFEFEYYLLLGENRAFTGQYETDVRLSCFFFTPGILNETTQDFLLNKQLQHTRWLWTPAADYRVTLSIPDIYLPAATGTETLLSTENHVSVWQIEADNVRDFALSFGKRYRESIAMTETVTGSGVTVRLLSNLRNETAVLDTAVSFIGVYERWLGEFPARQLDIVQSDYPVDALNFPGAIWLPEAILRDEKQLRDALGFCLAQQYLGLTACAQPVSDAWLSDVPCSYLTLLAIEELEGYEAFLTALNDQVLLSLRVTVPGGLYVTADAALFSAEEYDIIVRDRGTVVMHELRVAMGRSSLINAFGRFYAMGIETDCLGEYDFVAALDDATGGDWEDFLTDWLFTVDDYVQQQIEWYE